MYNVPLENVKRNKFVKGLLTLTSVKALALNVTGMIANYIQLVYQQIIEAGGGEHFNLGDFLQTMTNPKTFWQLTGTFKDNYSNNTNADLAVMSRFFNLFQEQPYAVRSAYYGNWLGRFFSNTEIVEGYSLGEHLGRLMTMKAMLIHVKV